MVYVILLALQWQRILVFLDLKLCPKLIDMLQIIGIMIKKPDLILLDERHGIWRCHFAGSCSVVCPKGVDPALGIQLLKGHMMGFSKNDKKVANLRAKNKE